MVDRMRVIVVNEGVRGTEDPFDARAIKERVNALAAAFSGDPKGTMSAALADAGFGDGELVTLPPEAMTAQAYVLDGDHDYHSEAFADGTPVEIPSRDEALAWWRSYIRLSQTHSLDDVETDGHRVVRLAGRVRLARVRAL